MTRYSRRSVLRRIGAVSGITAGLVSGSLTVAGEASDRFIVNVGDRISTEDRIRARQADLDVVHELDHVGALVVRGSESAVERISGDYHPDIRLERRYDAHVPDLTEMTAGGSSEADEVTASFSDVDVSSIVDGFPEAYVWDAATMDLPAAHDINQGTKPSGDPARIGIIDDGVYDHPALNVDVAASVDLTGDGKDVLHPNEQHYHGTHVGGIAAASGGSVTGSETALSSSDCESCGSFTTAELPFEDREVSDDGEATEKPQTVDSDSTVGSDSVSIDNGTLDVDVGELESGLSTSDWNFDGFGTLYRETYGVRDGTNTHYDAEDEGTVQSSFPSSTSPGDSATATVTMPIETDSGAEITLEMDREVTLDPTEPILRVDWEITNTSGSETIDDLRLSQYVDYDIDDVRGDYGKYFFDSETECEYIFLEDVETGKLAGFTADVPSVNHGLTEYSTGISRFGSSDPQFNNKDRQPDTGTDDVELAIEWSLGSLAPGESTTFRNSFVYGNSEEEFQELICEESPGDPVDPAGDGRAGVAPAAELVSMRYFSTAGAFFGDFAAAVEAAIITDCDVINASLGFVNDLPESRAYLIGYIENYIEELADTADQNGIVWVASAGNSANNANDLVPGSAKADNVLSVSAVGPTGIARPDGAGGTVLGEPLQSPTTPANYTTHGNEYVDVSAPGGSWDGYLGYDGDIRAHLAPDGVLSTYPPDTVTSSLNNDDPLPGVLMPDASGNTAYGFLQGTSMSAPQVAGVAALLSAENPDWSPREIRRVIKATARNVGKTTYHGHGLVDPVAALEVDDPADVRGQLGRPGDRDDRGRNESGGGSPRNSSGGSGGSNRGRSRGDDDDDDDNRDQSRGDDDDDDNRGRSR